MLASAVANAGLPVRAHLLIGDDVGEPALTALAEALAAAGGELAPVRIRPEPLAGLTVTGSLPLAHWYRQLLPELDELAALERILYLDADLLVLAPLAELWETPLGDAALAAVDNVFPDPATGARYCEALGIDPGSYFNTGVMLLDLPSLRRLESFARIGEFARASEVPLILPEQDAMNAVLANRRLRLHPRWNAMTALAVLPHARAQFPPGQVDEALAKPAIRHFEGSVNKPWSAAAPAEDRELWGRWASLIPAGLGAS